MIKDLLKDHPLFDDELEFLTIKLGEILRKKGFYLYLSLLSF
jgi:hypothetical protein